MADIKLFNIKGNVKEYQSGNVTLEKELQTVIEDNMTTFFGVTFLASEYRTTDGGRMDSIGIDENHCPVIFEYKRSVKENVINQGLFYLNWLLDHKDSFKVLVIEKLGLKASDNIDWTIQDYCSWRGIRFGADPGKTAFGFPVKRGMAVRLDRDSFLLWTHGCVIHPELSGTYNYFKGSRGIPAPLLVRRFCGNASGDTLAKEILMLTKMNWNSGDSLYKTLPVTLDFTLSFS